jgi:large subunit ribosomal protein L6
MSRIGRKPVVVPANVKVSIADSTINVEGPKGKLSFAYRSELGVRYDEAAKQVLVTRPDDERQNRALHGLTRSLIANMVQGVTEGYTKKLEIVGVGYQAQLKKANTVALQVGYANQVVLEAPAGVSVVVPDPTHITISGSDKQAVGQFAAEVRKVRPPEPYKGKGIRYEGEVVRRKAGKAFGSK